MPTPRKSAKLLEKLIDDPGKALGDRQYWSEAICRRWLAHVAAQYQLDVAKALRLAIVGVRLALRVAREQQKNGIRHPCILAHALANLGWIYCAAGELVKASKTLAKAAALVARCTDPDERSNVHRLQASLHVFLAQRSDGACAPDVLREGMRLAELALREARSPLAEVRALNARGYLEVASGHPGAGAASARRALELLGPNADLYTHAATTSLLVWALSSGSTADRHEAVAHLEQLREILPRRSQAHRARLLWAEALLHVQNPRCKLRARLRLDQARRKFLKLEMHAEAVATTADLMRLDPAGPVPSQCQQLLAILDPGPIRELVASLQLARLPQRLDLAEQLRRVVKAPGLLPAAAWPKP